MATMKAIQISQIGAPSMLVLSKHIPKPTLPLAAGHILVKNSFAGVNFIDTYHRSGLYKVPLPYTPGREATGLVEAVGENVTTFKVGDSVAHLSPSCYAEYSTVSAGYAVHLPSEISLEAGASLLLQGLTAMALSRIAHKVQPGEFALVYAAAGGTGQMLVQICKNIGAIVIGITSSAEKAQLAKTAGADHVITYSTEDIHARVMEITNGQGVHVVFDGVGKSSFDTSLACVRKLGSMLSFGNASGKVDPIDIMKLGPKQVRLMRPSLFQLVSTEEEFQSLAKELIDLVKNKKVSTHIHKIYDLVDCPLAHTDLESGSTTGKLILRI
ncbi:hypothetical protein BDV3_003084 [Batrachochytrium dendrobatidis]|nr:hypothetical protein O5D80_001426 [Batrachochytrium dendrobatidis]KAK5665419.1 hypothetical protein QVD99_007770 [Batrachochytrium dendrobatidis]